MQQVVRLATAKQTKAEIEAPAKAVKALVSEFKGGEAKEVKWFLVVPRMDLLLFVFTDSPPISQELNFVKTPT